MSSEPVVVRCRGIYVERRRHRQTDVHFSAQIAKGHASVAIKAAKFSYHPLSLNFKILAISVAIFEFVN